MTRPKDPSRLRQALLDSERLRAAQIQTVLAERGPLVRGSFVLQPGRCGKPGCRCARGEFHNAAALYTRQEGRQICTYVPLADRDRVEKLNRRYQRARKSRAEIAKLGRRSLQLIDELQEALTEPHAPSHEASRRRRPKGSKEP